MSAIDPISEHFIRAEKLRLLRQKLAEETNISVREELIRQVEELEELNLRPASAGLNLFPGICLSR
jgi:hypothetical protein